MQVPVPLFWLLWLVFTLLLLVLLPVVVVWCIALTVQERRWRSSPLARGPEAEPGAGPVAGRAGWLAAVATASAVGWLSLLTIGLLNVYPTWGDAGSHELLVIALLGFTGAMTVAAAAGLGLLAWLLRRRWPPVASPLYVGALGPPLVMTVQLVIALVQRAPWISGLAVAVGLCDVVAMVLAVSIDSTASRMRPARPPLV